MTDNTTARADLAGLSPAALLTFLNDNRGALPERMGIEILEASEQRVVGRMPVQGNTQPYGLLHGGASVVLAETIGSAGAAIQAGPGRAAMGLEINATHHRGVRSGYVTGTARALSLGRTVAAYEVEIVDDDGNRICTSRISCILRDNPTKAR